jgi:nifR3 family TIM-barrel protein
MISCKGLLYNNQQTADMLAVSDCETPCAVQLFGCQADNFEAAVADARLDHFDIIDINMGCPVSKIIKHGEGSALMGAPQVAADIVRACVRSSNGRPVTVKCRLGLEWGDKTVVQFALRLQDAGAAALTVHGRYQQQLYKGQSDWGAIAEVACALDIPVIGSGDVVDSATWQQALSSGVAAVMIARAAVGNPTVFAQFQHGAPPATNQVKMQLCYKHFALTLQYNPSHAVSSFKKHFASYVSGMQGSSQIKQRVHRLDSVSATWQLIEELQGEHNGKQQ